MRLFEDIYYYKHPIGANCNVYAFLDGNHIDLIDTGVKKLRIVRWLLKEMKKDGLQPANVRKIIHPHYHFDHVQADSFFQTKIISNGDVVPVFVPENDLFRTTENFDLMKWNLNELKEKFGPELFHQYFNNYQRAFKLGGLIFSKLIHVKTPKNIRGMKNGQKIQVGKREAKVISTGGHTEGHSFLFFDDEDKILYTGDHDALNEFTCDWGKTLESVRIAQSLKPDNVFIGHNNPKLGPNDARDWLSSYFTQFESIFAPILPKFREGQKINLSAIIRKMMGWISNMKGLDLWANMSIYAIGKHLEELGLGQIELGFDPEKAKRFCFFFNITENPRKIDLINLIKNGNH